MKKIFTKLFLLTTLLMVSGELWAEDYWLVLNDPAPKTIPWTEEKTFSFNLVGPAEWIRFELDSYGTMDVNVYGYRESNPAYQVPIAEHKKAKEGVFKYDINGQGFSRIEIKVKARTDAAKLLNVIAYSPYYDYEYGLGSAEYKSAEASTSFTIDYYGTPNFSHSYLDGDWDNDKFSVKISASGGKATVTVTYPHDEVGKHDAMIIISNGVFRTTPYRFTGTTTIANQTITWNMGNKALNVGDQLTLNATASSGLGVTYTSSNTSVVTVSGNTIKAVGEGSATITASQSGNTNYNAATSKSYIVTVSKKKQSITWTPPTELTVGDTHTLSATAPGGAVSYAVTGDAVTRSGNTLTAVKEGTVTITASQAGNSNYKAAANVTKTITIKKATPKVTAWPTIAPVTYGTNLGAALVLKGGSASVAGTFVITDSYNAADVPNAGTHSYNLEFRPTETNKYNNVSGGTATLTVNKANQTITWDMGNQSMYVGGQLTLNATASSTLGVTYTSSNTSVVTVSGNTLTAVGEGNATITASQAGNSNYNAATDITYTVSVSKKDQTITWTPPTEMTVGDTHTLSATATSGDAVAFAISGDAATLAGNTLTAVQAGTVTITASQSGNNYYNAAANVTHSITINKATPNVSAWPTLDAVTYGATLEQALVLVGGTASVAGTFAITDSYNAADVPNAGTHTYGVEFRPTESNKYNNVSGGTATLTVNKADQVIAWTATPPTEMTVGDSHTLSATATSGGAVAFAITGDAATLADNTLTAVQAGTVTITASQAGNGNYNAAANITHTITINKATPTVTAWPTIAAVAYGATLEQALVLVGGTASVEGTFAITDAYTAATVPNAGAHTYNLEFRPTENNKYNVVSGGSATLVVNKADQVLTWDFADCTLLPGQTLALDATSTCGAVSYELTGSAISVSGNTLTAVATGTATIKAVDAGNSNYNAVESSVYTVTVSESGYTRAVTNGNYGTICLPYGSSSYAGAEFYEIAYAEIKNDDATGLYLDQLEEDAVLVAGKPYIFKATADKLEVSYEGAMATTPVAGEAGLTGTLVDIAAGGVLEGNYIIAQNMFWDASAANWLNANRAYINKETLLSVPPKSLVPGRRRVSMGETSENGATGVENTVIAPNSLKVIENGQLIIIRDGVKYNAQGVRL